MRVMVAMSGGVDSSAAAALMVEAGHEVFGATMKLRDVTPEEACGDTASCCSPSDLRDAAAACDALGIPHYVIDYRAEFHAAVVVPFAEDYVAGRTPNPCVRCNDHIKFAPLIARARMLGAEALVTGHYARIAQDASGRYQLLKGVDPRKDQSYFLFGLDQDALSFVRFPLGGLIKDDVRVRAQALGLESWNKPDSEDICFVPDGDYARVVEQVLGVDRVPPAGRILNERGEQLGTHGGVHRYTVGQRKGLGIATGERLYVLSVNAADGDVVVGEPERLRAQGLVAHDCRWLGLPPEGAMRCTARIRYRHAGVSAEVVPSGTRALVRFDTPERAIAPGQAVVFYDGDVVLGGGWIAHALMGDADDNL